MKLRELISKTTISMVVLSLLIFSTSNCKAAETMNYYSMVKNNILQSKTYDEFYDVNDDGVVNVFDAIRINQNECHEDLKKELSDLKKEFTDLKSDLNLKANKIYGKGSSVGVSGTGMISVTGQSATSTNFNHTELDVFPGQVFFVSGWGFSSDYPLFRVLDASGKIIKSDYTDDKQYTDVKVCIPSNGVKLYVVGRTSIPSTINETNATDLSDIASELSEVTAEVDRKVENVYNALNDKADKVYEIKKSIGVLEDGMVSIKGASFANANHVEIDVNEGENYYVSGWAYNADFPLYRVLNSSDEVISYGGTDDRAYTNEKIVIPNNGVKLYVVGKPSMKTSINIAYINAVITSTNDNTDRTAEIQSAIDEYGYVKLGTGIFHTNVIYIDDSCRIEGCGDETTLVLRTVHTAQSIFMTKENDISSSDKCVSSISNIKLFGGLTEKPTNYAGRNKRVGIHHLANNHILRLNNVTIEGFNGDGIHVKNVGLEEGYSLETNNCMIKYCGCGLNFDAKAEYANITNTLFHFNHCGCNNYGGNNKFVNCGFENNTYGMFFDRGSVYVDTVMPYLNNGHSSACGCSFNHNSFPLTVGTYYNGFAFVGCMIYGGKIITANSAKGLMFEGCMIGSQTEFDLRTNDLFRMINCVFSGKPTISVPTSNNNIYIEGCYELENGTAVTKPN